MQNTYNLVRETTTKIHICLPKQTEKSEGIMLVHVLVSLIALICYISVKRNHRETAKLPPGSLGWPYVGETLQLYSQDPNVFFARKQERLVRLISFMF